MKYINWVVIHSNLNIKVLRSSHLDLTQWRSSSFERCKCETHAQREWFLVNAMTPPAKMSLITFSWRMDLSMQWSHMLDATQAWLGILISWTNYGFRGIYNISHSKGLCTCKGNPPYEVDIPPPVTLCSHHLSQDKDTNTAMMDLFLIDNS